MEKSAVCQGILMDEKFDIDYENYLLRDAMHKLRGAAIVLGICGFLNALITIAIISILFSEQVQILFFYPVLIWAGVSSGFFFLAFYIRKKPRTAIISGLVYYCAIFLLYFLTSNIHGTFLVITLVILISAGFIILIKSVKSASEAERIIKRIGEIPETSSFDMTD